MSRASDGTNLGFTRDWHFTMRKSDKSDLRAGAKTRDPGENRRAERVTMLRFAILTLGPRQSGLPDLRTLSADLG